MRFFSEFINVMLDTENFFSQIKTKSVRGPLLYFGILSFIALLTNWVLIFNGITPAGLMPFKEMIKGMTDMGYYITLMFFLVGLVFVVFYSKIIQLFLKRANASTELKNVYKTVCYGLTPSILTMWIPVVGVLLLFWSLYIQSMGLNIYNSAGLKKNVFSSLKAGIVASIIVVAFMISLGVYLISVGGMEMNMLYTMILP